MKYKFDFNFEVEYSISDVSVQLGVSKEEIEDSNLRDLFVSGSGDLESGEIEVSDDYAANGEPKLYEDELYARFYASYTVEVEGESYSECYDKATKAFENADFGDYSYSEVSDLDIDAKVAEVTLEDISEYLDVNGFDTQSYDEEFCQELADKCNARFEEMYESEQGTDEILIKEEVIEEVIGEAKGQQEIGGYF